MKKVVISILALAVIIAGPSQFGCGDRGKDMDKSKPETVRDAVVAGKFYPKDPQALREMIEGFYSKTPDIPLGSNMIGAVCPHAGYVYSGPVASYVFKNLPKDVFDTVIILFPSHYKRFRGVLALDVDAYATPLGNVKIDRDLTRKLIDADPAIFYGEGVYEREHSMEVMLPFLQVSLGDDFKLVALMMGDQTPNMARRLAGDIETVVGDRRVLVIASTDMSHYHPYETANALDSRALTHMINLDDLALINDLRGGKTELCGYGPTLTLMHLAKSKGAKRGKVLKHANSGDTQGGKEKVVGYCSVAFFSKKRGREIK